MLDLGYVVENGTFYLLTAQTGKRTSLANLRIVMSMFCEGKMNINDVILNLDYKQIEDIINTDVLTNTDELDKLTGGLAASKGVGVGLVCFSYDEATRLIDEEKEFIYCRLEVFPEDIEIIGSSYCQGVMTARGGMTSHAAVVCRGLGLACVSDFGDYEKIKVVLESNKNYVTIDGNNGVIYGGTGKLKKRRVDMTEINLLYQLLKICIKCNAVISTTSLLVWRLWDVVVLGRIHGGTNKTKRMVDKETNQYISFKQPTKEKIDEIERDFYSIKNGSFIVEDLIDFLISQLSTQVSLGEHYSYVSPLLDPMKCLYSKKTEDQNLYEFEGFQITGIKFFKINQFLEYLIDIESIRIYFKTKYYCDNEADDHSRLFPLNYLDFTNPKGESLIINTYDANEFAIYINNVLITANNLPMVYHLIRRRVYHWSWYNDNNISRNEILNYLSLGSYQTNTKLYYLCKEMHLIDGNELTSVGLSLLGR